MKFFNWFAGFFQDQKGSASSKRATLYITLFFMWRMIENSINGKVLGDPTILYINTLIILFCLGAITSEFFNKINLPLTKEDKKEVKPEENK